MQRRSRKNSKFYVSSFIIMLLILIGVIFIGTGYAALNSTLTISGEAKVNPSLKKLLYVPFDDVEGNMLLYAPMDGIGYVNQNYKQQDPPFIDKINNMEFKILGGKIVHSTSQIKKGTKSAYFSGLSGQRINAKISDLNLGTSDFTISVWVYSEEQVMQYPMIFSSEDNNTLRFRINNPTYDNKIVIASGNDVLITAEKNRINEWIHYAFVRKDGVFTLYENGINIGSTDKFKTLELNISDFSIGGNSSDKSSFKGYIDDFAVYHYAKWDSNFTPPVDAQSNANILYLDFEDELPNELEFTEQPLYEKISDSKFTLLGNADLEGRDNQFKFGGSSLYFPGTTGQRINAKISNLNLGTSDFTVSVWVYPEEQVMQYPMIFSSEDNDTLRFRINNNSIYDNKIVIASGDDVLITAEKKRISEWVHYAFVRKDGIFTLYENGINIGSTDKFKTLKLNISDFSIGGNSSDKSSFKGYIDDFAIYNYAKYTENFTLPTVNAEKDPANKVAGKLVIKDLVSNNDFTVKSNANLVVSDEIKKFGEGALYFPGTVSQSINLNVPELNLGTRDFTVSFWVYPEEQVMQYPMIFSNDDNRNIAFYLYDGVNNGNITFVHETNNKWIRIINTDKKYKINEWTHYAVVRKEGVFTIYENGINIGSTDQYKTILVNISSFSIGGNSSETNSSFKGYIDDFVIYNKAIYDGEFPPPTKAAGQLE